MRTSYLILGVGKQGVAAAYDVASFEKSARIILADCSLERARFARRKIQNLLGNHLRESNNLLSVEQIDAQHLSGLKTLLKGCHALLSALPYYFNPTVAELAVDSGVSYCDLGGYFQTTQTIQKLHSKAKKKGVTLISDCGVSPGMSNSLAVCGMDQLTRVEDVFIYCGGLPQKPVGPLGYKIVFNLEGVLGNYFGDSYVLENGKVKKVPSLSQRETIDLGAPLGKLEAAVTGGATSTCPWTFKGRVKNYIYKTLRYPGHFEKIDLLNELGLLDTVPVKLNGYAIVPRKFFAVVAQKNLSFKEEADILVLRVIVRGEKEGKKIEIVYNILDHMDPKTGFSAMQRTTGFSSAVVLRMLGHGLIEQKGVVPLEKAVPGEFFLREIRRRGIQVNRSIKVKKDGVVYAQK